MMMCTPNRKKIRIIVVGSILPGKGQEFLISAFTQIANRFDHDFIVDCYGAGKLEYVNLLRKRCANLPASVQFRFVGHNDNVHLMRKNYDIAVVSSRSEAFGRTIIEAMASRNLLVCSSSGSGSELVEHGKTGLLFEYGNIESFDACLREYFSKGCEEICNILNSASYFAQGFQSDKGSVAIRRILFGEV